MVVGDGEEVVAVAAGDVAPQRADQAADMIWRGQPASFDAAEAFVGDVVAGLDGLAVPAFWGDEVLADQTQSGEIERAAVGGDGVGAGLEPQLEHLVGDGLEGHGTRMLVRGMQGGDIVPAKVGLLVVDDHGIDVGLGAGLVGGDVGEEVQVGGEGAGLGQRDLAGGGREEAIALRRILGGGETGGGRGIGSGRGGVGILVDGGRLLQMAFGMTTQDVAASAQN